MDRITTPARRVYRPLKFGVDWEPRLATFRSSWDAVSHGPKPLPWEAGFPPSPLRVTFIRGKAPKRAYTAAALCHIAVILLAILPIWRALEARTTAVVEPQYHLTYVPLPDLSPLSPSKSPSKPSPKGRPNEPLPREGADAFHPRQTILSQPQNLTHPRQTLIQPDAPATPPTIEPRLPNIVEWGASAPAVPPKLALTPSDLKPILQNIRKDTSEAPEIRDQFHTYEANTPPGQANPPDLKMPVTAGSGPISPARTADDAAVPQIETATPNSSALNIAPSVSNVPSARMPTAAGSGPIARTRTAEDAAVPQIENGAPNSGALNIAPAVGNVPAARMPIGASSARIAPSQKTQGNVGQAPQIAGAVPNANGSVAGLSGSSANAVNVARPAMTAGGSGAPIAPSQKVQGGAGQTPQIAGAVPNANGSVAGLSGSSANAANIARPAMTAGGGGAPIRREKTSGGGDAGPAPAIIGPASEGDSSMRRLVAISPNPAPPSTKVAIPKGNLNASSSTSPNGGQPGVPGGSPNGPANAAGNGGGGNSAVGGSGNAGGSGVAGPPSVSISTTKPGATSPIGGNSSDANNASANSAENASPVNPMKRKPSLGPGNFDTGVAPEKVLGDKRIYTMYMNLPNLTSASGSWVLNFAQLRAASRYNDTTEVTSPVPVRKVDPKYPTSLVDARVEGEVVLYAIIRSDGTVDSIQVLRSLDPQLDRNAIEALARWRFSPANRNGIPIDIEAVVHIPFRVPSEF
jgi:protein TonB